MPQAAFSGPWSSFVRTVTERLETLHEESGGNGLVLPVGLLLVVDHDHGGDETADEVIRRFHLLDRESRSWIDFYYLGWEATDDGPVFDLTRFGECRDKLRDVGVKTFGGNADLILLDTSIAPTGETFIHFDTAIRIDLTKEGSAGALPPLGTFLQAVIQAAEEVHADARRGDRAVHRMSDRLGVMYAKESLLDFILEKWGKVFGAVRLRTLAVRNLGPRMPLAALEG